MTYQDLRLSFLEDVEGDRENDVPMEEEGQFRLPVAVRGDDNCCPLLLLKKAAKFVDAMITNYVVVLHYHC